MKDYKRLTKWSELGNLHVFDINGKEIPLCDMSPIDTDNLAGRLADLEDKIENGEIDYAADRGKQIARLTAENAELRATLSKMETVEKELRERLKKAGKLPCEVGDTLYEPFINRIREWIVDSIYVFSLGINVNCERKDDCRWHDHFAIRENCNDFESRVYLTREAAEAKLKGEEKNG